MTLLLDTHILLWALAEPRRLSEERVQLIGDPTNTVLVSEGSVAEVAIKASIGTITVEFDLREAIREAGFDLIDFAAAAASRLKDLPFHHRDPFDRMLIVQSMDAGFPIMTDDERFQIYECRTL